MNYITEHKYKEKIGNYFKHNGKFRVFEEYFLTDILDYCYHLDKYQNEKHSIVDKFTYSVIHDVITEIFGEDAKLGYKYLARDAKELFYTKPLGGNIHIMVDILNKWVWMTNLKHCQREYPLVTKCLFEMMDQLKGTIQKEVKESTNKMSNKNPESNIKEKMSDVGKSAHKAEIMEGFKKYTDFLAETLTKKNLAYGNSFDKDMEIFGYANIGIRLHDKYGRIEHLIKNNKTTENDESLLDSLLDLAGYSILSIKNLMEKGKIEGLKGLDGKD
ncbi:hypothetical protein FP435_04655 [Lactobacillus sp. PV037]|uniref:hypothetical protein n=1 Tax=Lactobacillus sp. PV037 TaxID=2594496 RepID=UPI002240353C|nr:hypothetical protein [Lactobacillus sp. PV037]QNQ83782.1 hypothetical protein FP435_04655 [Lactobacillus sp. PV037]